MQRNPRLGFRFALNNANGVRLDVRSGHARHVRQPLAGVEQKREAARAGADRPGLSKAAIGRQAACRC